LRIESQTLLHNNSLALYQDVNALVSIDSWMRALCSKGSSFYYGMPSTTNSLQLIDSVQHTCSLLKWFPSIYELEIIHKSVMLLLHLYLVGFCNCYGTFS
jgi:hypothetical protein